MATKKQKRLAAIAKRERFMATDKRIGLNAQKRNHEEKPDTTKRTTYTISELLNILRTTTDNEE